MVYYYISRLSLNKTSTVIGWFLITCPDQIQMYPDRDTIAQLLHACRIRAPNTRAEYARRIRAPNTRVEYEYDC